MAPDVLLVANPTAQSGKAEGRIKSALAAMKHRGWSAELLATLPDGKTVPALAAAIDAGSHDTVVYMGGDGTFAEVAKGVLAAERRVPMGMLPSGTANDQGKSFGISSAVTALEDNLDIIAHRETLFLDIGRVERLNDDDAVTHTDLFFDSAGWGMQPDILAIRNRDRRWVGEIPVLQKMYRDHAVYAGAVLDRYLASWLEPTKFSAEVVADGQRHSYRGLTDLVVKNTAIYGGEWVLDRRTEPDDGQMELVAVKGRRELVRRAMVGHKVFHTWAEHLEALGVKHTAGPQARLFEVTLIRPGREQVHAQVDGEEWEPGQRYRVEVLGGRLEIIVRDDWFPPWKSPV